MSLTRPTTRGKRTPPTGPLTPHVWGVLRRLRRRWHQLPRGCRPALVPSAMLHSVLDGREAVVLARAGLLPLAPGLERWLRSPPADEADAAELLDGLCDLALRRPADLRRLLLAVLREEVRSD